MLRQTKMAYLIAKKGVLAHDGEMHYLVAGGDSRMITVYEVSSI